MNPSIFTVNNNLNITSEKNPEKKGDLRYIFLIRKSENENNICFSIVLKNSSKSIINNVWFSAFVGISSTKFAPGLDDQDSFYIKSFLGSHLSGYTKESFKLPPETILEILYFDIPKEKLSDEGSLEFYYGYESVKTVSFAASWDKGELRDKIKGTNIDTQTFINFLKYKNHKTCFERMDLVFRKLCKFSKKTAIIIKSWFYKSIDSLGQESK